MSTMPESHLQRRMPAEWEPHEATWIAWPHFEDDWPGKYGAIPWVYAEIVRAFQGSERLEVLCQTDETVELANDCFRRAGLGKPTWRCHVVPTNRSWLRDSAPTAVRTIAGAIEWIDWRFNGWARYDNHELDDLVPDAVERISGLTRIEARRPDGRGPLVLEGGAIDTDGEGTLLVTEECLLSDSQVRNPGLGRRDYERVFAEYLGIGKVVWLGSGCAGDDTHGHVDDVARFVGPGVVALSYEPDPADDNHEAAADNLRRLESARDAAGRPVRVVKLPMPRPIVFNGDRLPASYANFYIANRAVLVPTFNDPSDRVALATLADLFPDRRVVGIHATDLVWGLGTLHCSTQQQPVATGGVP